MTYKIKDSGKRKVYQTGANRDVNEEKGRFDLLPPQAIRALAIHYQKGCQKYHRHADAVDSKVVIYIYICYPLVFFLKLHGGY